MSYSHTWYIHVIQSYMVYCSNIVKVSDDGMTHGAVNCLRNVFYLI